MGDETMAGLGATAGAQEQGDGTKKRQGGGGKLSRSETVTVRLDPKLRYLAELAARKQRRTLSSFIEWSIEDSLDRVILSVEMNSDVSVADEASSLWDVDDADRFAKLAIRYPQMLNHDEQVLWKLIRENGYLWRGNYHKVSREWTWRIDEGSLILERLREYWDKFNAVAKQEEDKRVLPTWAKEKDPPRNSSRGSIDDLDDDIPF